jgi:hypothetical protein
MPAPMPDSMPATSPTRTPILARAAVTVLLATGLLVGTLAAEAGASRSSEKAQAQKHLLVLADLPKGWSKEKGSSGGSNTFPGEKQLAGCIGVPVGLIGANPPDANSPYYQNTGDSLEVQDSVSVFSSAKYAKSEYAALSNTKTPSCMGALMNGPFKSQIAASAGHGTTLGNITVTGINASEYGAHVAGFNVSLPFTSQGISITATLTAIYFIRGTLGQQITFNAYNAKFPVSLAKHLVSVAMGRL